MKSKVDLRKSQYKKGVDLDESRRKREELSTGLRKNKREENLMKKRNLNTSTDGVVPTQGTVPSSLPSGTIQQHVLDCYSTVPEAQLRGTTSIRKMLSVETNPPIDDVLASGIVPRFIHFLTLFDQPTLQYEAAWALTNLLSGNTKQALAVIEAGIIPPLVNLLRSPSADVSEQATWAIGNIAGEGHQHRDELLKHDAFDLMLSLYNRSPNINMIRNTTWALSNLCRGKPSPSFDITSRALPVLKELLKINDKHTIADTLWALSYITDDGDENKLAALISMDFPALMTPFLSFSETLVSLPALRACGNVVTGTHVQTQTMLDAGLIAPLLGLINSSKKLVRKECCWVLSNVTAGTPQQIESIFTANLVSSLINCLRRGDFDVRKEAGWALTNVFSGGSEDQKKKLLSYDFMPALVEMLSVQDQQMVTLGLGALSSILALGAKSAKNNMNVYSAQFEEAGGVDVLEKLQQHANNKIYKEAVKLIDTYFETEEEDENEEVNVKMPNDTPAQFNFNFGVTPMFQS